MSCHKLAFDTVEAAERTASVIAGLRPSVDRAPVRIYECPACGRLHFTSKPAVHDGRDSTVAAVNVEPAFVPVKPEAALSLEVCAYCEAPGAKLELYGKKYHRKCRTKAIASLTPEQRKAWQREQTWGDYVRALEQQGYTVIPPGGATP